MGPVEAGSVTAREKGRGKDRLAWARFRFEFYLLPWFLVLCPFSCCVPFFLSSAISYKLVLGILCIPVQFCINALDLRELPS